MSGACTMRTQLLGSECAHLLAPPHLSSRAPSASFRATPAQRKTRPQPLRARLEGVRSATGAPLAFKPHFSALRHTPEGPLRSRVAPPRAGAGETSGDESSGGAASDANGASGANGASSEQLAGFPRSAPGISGSGTGGGSGGDLMLKCITGDAEVSVTAVVGTSLAQEAQRRHSLAPTAAAALGRLLMGTMLMGAKAGTGEVLQVSVNGRGPIGRMTAVATDSGQVKGFVGNPECDPPLNSRGKMDVGAAVGQGVITVVRTHPSWQQPYTGTVPIQTGEIAEDLAHYLAESEQVNSALGLGVAVGRDGIVLAAGGFLVQVLPFCSEETLQLLEKNVTAMPAVSDLVQAGEGPLDMVGRLLQGLEWRQAGEQSIPSYGPCGADALRPRMLNAVLSLGGEEVQSLLKEQGKVEVRCEFCAETLEFSPADLEPLLAESSSQ